jgi:Carboxypeptidase regulatory-like domain/TonB-dependent Receptor Plug Domain
MAIDRNAVNWFGRCAYVSLTCLFFLLVQTRTVFGQVDQGSVSGIVQDASGAVIPNAKVTLLNKDVGLSMETTTQANGEYTFTPVRIGNYSVSVTAPGFSTTTQENLQVSVQQHLQVNIQLKTGATTETVEVNTTPALLQTEEGSVGQVITEKTINSLPLNGRNFTFLAQLGAGVNTPQADTRGNAASGAFSANGLRPSQNNYLLDGIDNNSDTVDFLNGTNFIVLPPVDAIQEFKVQTADFSADLGRSAGAVLNATIKSGTNSYHGAVWEFLRNDKLDAADWFTNNNGTRKGELRLNQFGASIGGPIVKNKLFFFGDYEGLRVVQGVTSTATVPTLNERNSGFTNLSDLLQTKTQKDALGRIIPLGTVLDPATTRPVNGGYVRDPFLPVGSPCSAATIDFSTGCVLNQIPVARLDPNAIKLLNLYPLPTSGAKNTTNFASSPKSTQNRNAFDVRADFNPSDKNQVFFRFSYVDDPQFIPGTFGGIADGGAFQQGIQTAKADQAALGFTHAFSPSAVNVARAGFNHLHTTRFGPEGSTLGIPAQFGIQGIPQVPENGGLPGFTFGGLSNLGGNNFLPSDEVSQTLQITDDFTKIYGKHSFKTGIEYQHVKFSTLQPAYSRGQFDYNGTYTDVPNSNQHTTGIAQFLLQPELATVPNGVNYSGGSDQVQASNINKTYDVKNYFAAYFQDDWKVSPKMTLNLGVRWDYFGPLSESNGGQANFIQSGPPNGQPEFLIPATGKDNRTLSTSFVSLLAKDGIALVLTDKYGNGLTQTQKNNFSPRVGFAYQASPKAVIRGGVGMFYNAFENQGYGPNIGENYPFVYNFNYQIQGAVNPVSAGTPFAGCPTGGPGGTATFESGFSCLSFTPSQVNGSQLNLQGLQFNYQTPVTLSSNLTVQYSLTPTLSATVGYVLTNAWNLQTGVGNNNPSQIWAAGTNLTTTPGALPFPDFARNGSYQRTIGSSDYNGLQTKIEQSNWKGLSFLATYTYSKTLSDAGDLLNGGSAGSYRAPAIPGLGIGFDNALAAFDIRNVFHFSGGYNLPFGKGKQFLSSSGKLTNAIVGGWSANWIVTLEGGQPITLTCPTGTTSGTNCDDVKVPGQSQKLGLHLDSNNKLSWYGNPNAFQQPCPLGAPATAGCIAATGAGLLGGNPATTTGPPIKTFDFSAFKAFQLTERFSMQFRSEFFNIFNHANFNAPNFNGNGVVGVSGSGNFTSNTFGEIGSTRTAPRQVQFALKLYY